MQYQILMKQFGYFAYSGLGIAYREIGEFDNALKNIDEAIKIDPSEASIHLYRGNIHRVKGDLDEAIADYDEAIRLQPDEDFRFHLAIASTSKQLGKGYSPDYNEKARLIMSEDDWYNHACLESVCDNFDLAFEYLQKATESDDFDPEWAWKDLDLQWIRMIPGL